MRPIVTLKGIDEAISNLHYSNVRSQKHRLINAIRGYYSDEDSVRSLNGIDTDELVKLLWEIGNNPLIIRNRRKNFSSIKSAVNADLNRLHKAGQNPEGVIIGSANVFDMSEEAKSKILESFTFNGTGDSPVPIGKIAEALEIVNEMSAKDKKESEGGDFDSAEKLKQLQKLIRSISDKINISEGSGKQDNIEKNNQDMSDGDSGEKTGEYGLSDKAFDKTGKGDAEAGPLELLEDDEEVEEIGDEDEIEEIEEEQEAEDEWGGELLEDDEEVEEIGDEDEIEEVEEEQESEDVGGPELLEDDEESEEAVGDLSFDELFDSYGISGFEGEDKGKKARYLAEKFNQTLSARDRYYNQYILIPKGRYIVGINPPVKNEQEERIIELGSFYIGKFPVINALFEIFVEETGYITTAERLGYGTVYNGRYRTIVDHKTGYKTIDWNSSVNNEKIEGAFWYQPLGPGSTLHNKRNHPVVQVSIEDALAFSAWTGKRLPTEVEWESAARTKKGYPYPWGKSMKEESCNIEDAFIGDTTPVDQYEAKDNSLAIVDTLGNVLEWVLDSSLKDSQRANGQYYILKGGSWRSGKDLRLTNRFSAGPETHSNIIGFRCVAY